LAGKGIHPHSLRHTTGIHLLKAGVDFATISQRLGHELKRVQMRTTTEAKRETLNLRIKADVRDLIDRAAKSRGKNRTDFILDAARAGAEDALLDQVMMTVTPQAYARHFASPIRRLGHIPGISLPLAYRVARQPRALGCLAMPDLFYKWLRPNIAGVEPR